MRRGARQDRHEDRRDNGGPVAKVAIGAAVVNRRRGGSGSGSNSESDDGGPKTYVMREKVRNGENK